MDAPDIYPEMWNSVLKSCLKLSYHVNDENEYGRFCVHTKYEETLIKAYKACRAALHFYNTDLAVLYFESTAHHLHSFITDNAENIQIITTIKV